MHVDADQLQAVAAHDGDGSGDVVDPDAVLALRAAGVGLVAVAVAEARVDAQPHAVPRRVLADAFEHVERAGVDGDAVLDDGGQGGVVNQVGREHHAGRLARGLEAGGQAALDLAQRHRVHHHALGAHQAQDVQVGAGLLRVADDVEAAQLGDALADDGGIVDPQRVPCSAAS